MSLCKFFCFVYLLCLALADSVPPQDVPPMPLCPTQPDVSICSADSDVTLKGIMEKIEAILKTCLPPNLDMLESEDQQNVMNTAVQGFRGFINYVIFKRYSALDRDSGAPKQDDFVLTVMATEFDEDYIPRVNNQFPSDPYDEFPNDPNDEFPNDPNDEFPNDPNDEFPNDPNDEFSNVPSVSADDEDVGPERYVRAY